MSSDQQMKKFMSRGTFDPCEVALPWTLTLASNAFSASWDDDLCLRGNQKSFKAGTNGRISFFARRGSTACHSFRVSLSCALIRIQLVLPLRQGSQHCPIYCLFFVRNFVVLFQPGKFPPLRQRCLLRMSGPLRHTVSHRFSCETGVIGQRARLLIGRSAQGILLRGHPHGRGKVEVKVQEEEVEDWETMKRAK